MSRISIRFYQELGDFLPARRRGVRFETEFPPGCTAKAVIESLGVPHTEVDLILANGESVGFAFRLSDGDDLSVYPVFESWDIKGFSRTRPEPLRRAAFVCDVHLGKLSALLRLFGFDTAYANDLDDDELVAVSRAEKRTILTRDRGLLKRRDVTHGYCVRHAAAREQISEVFLRFDLKRLAEPFSRCISCNARLERVRKDLVLSRIPPLVAKLYDVFSQCPSCGRVFWRGSHWERMKKLADEVLGGEVVK
jgi:uncharacterized protein with PIN domain